MGTPEVLTLLTILFVVMVVALVIWMVVTLSRYLRRRDQNKTI